MSTRNHGIGYLVAGVLVAFVLSACGGSKSPSSAVPPGSGETIAAASPVVSVVGTVDFMDGEVSVRSGGAAWREAELGDEVGASDSLRTGKNASCDIGFGPFGLVRMGADSTVEIKTVLLSAERKVASVRLAAGSVACKVSKLAGNDRFEIRTQTAVCGVRGTEFLVNELPGKPTKVAVREGSVAVLPPSFDADALEAAAVDRGGAAIVEAVVREIVEAAPLVKANEESVVSVEVMAESDRVIAEMNEIIVRELSVLAAATPGVPQKTAEPAAAPAAPVKEAAPAPVAAPPVAIPETITATLVKFSAKAETVIAPPAPIGAEARKALEKLPETLSAVPAAPAAVEAKSAIVESGAVRKTAESPSPEVSAVTAGFKLADAELIGGLSAQAGVFYAADAKGRLYTFAGDGTKRQTMQSGATANENSRPVPSMGALYFAGPSALVSFDATSAARRFSVPLDQSNSGFFGRRPTPAAGKLFSSSDSGLDVFDAATGRKLGSVALADGSDMTPAVSGDSVCLATRSGVFSIISTITLEVVASIPTRTVEPIASAASIVGGRAYFADRKGSAVCVDLGSREVAWKRPLEAGKTVSVFEDPAIAGETVLFFGKSSIFGLSLTDGAPKFAPIRSVAAPPCVVEGRAWFGSTDGTVKALEPATGKIIVSIPLDGKVVGRPASIGSLIAFPLENGKVAIVDAALAIGSVRR